MGRKKRLLFVITTKSREEAKRDVRDKCKEKGKSNNLDQVGISTASENGKEESRRRNVHIIASPTCSSKSMLQNL